MYFKERLLTPGPTAIPDRVLQAMSRSQLHHRSDVFKKELKKACSGVREVLNWNSDPVFLACSGTGALEAAVVSSCLPGDAIIYVDGGVFGARWGIIAERLGINTHRIEVPWGESVKISQIATAIQAAPKARAFCIQHSETSTTVLHPVREALAEVKRLAPEMLTIVDAISASVTTDVPGDCTSIDMYVAGSQKAYMLPPGLSFLTLSERAWKRVEETPKRSLYFDLALERKMLLKGETAWTPATTLILGLNEALAMLQEEGLRNVYERHERLSQIARVGFTSLGLKLLAPSNPCPSVTGFFAPEQIDADDLRKSILTQFGIRCAGGQGAWKGKVVRLGHMGNIDPFDVISAVTAIAITLQKKNYSIDLSTALCKMTELL